MNNIQFSTNGVDSEIQYWAQVQPSLKAVKKFPSVVGKELIENWKGLLSQFIASANTELRSFNSNIDGETKEKLAVLAKNVFDARAILKDLRGRDGEEAQSSSAKEPPLKKHPRDDSGNPAEEREVKRVASAETQRSSAKTTPSTASVTPNTEGLEGEDFDLNVFDELNGEDLFGQVLNDSDLYSDIMDLINQKG